MLPPTSSKWKGLDTLDVFLVLLITIVSLATRLFIIQHPDSVVFDEVHFGNFTNWYIKQEFFYDIHPPLGKLLMFACAELAEYDGSIDFAGRYGNQYQNEDFVVLRLTPAVFSSMCAPLIFLSVRFSGFGKTAGVIASSFIIFDTSLLVEHRFILSDGMLHFFTCLFLSAFSYITATHTRSPKALIGTGILLGCASSCKNTAWGLIAATAITQIMICLEIHSKFDEYLFVDVIERGFMLGVPTLLVYLESFAVHFMVIPYHGQGTPYLYQCMKDQLIPRSNTALWGVRIRFPPLFIRAIILTYNMHRGNMGITQFHGSQSRPINWPLLTGNWVGFWGNGREEIHCMGNALVYYMSFIGVVGCALLYKSKRWWISLRFVIAYAVSYFPFFLIPRSMFLYHYLIPLMLGAVCYGMFAEMVFKRFLPAVGIASVLLAMAGFVLWCPYAYGIKHMNEKYTIWNDNWKWGDSVHRSLQAAPRK